METNGLPAAWAQLDTWADATDAELSVINVLWDMAALEQSRDKINKARAVVQDMRDRLVEEVTERDVSDITQQRDILAKMIHQDFGFIPDTNDPKPETINLASVIEQRKGLPIALAVLYMELAHSQNWPVDGINFPGHFLVRLGQGNHTLLIDPNDGAVLQASDLRRLLKDVLGVHAELQHNHYQTAKPREIVMRFYNNQKTAFIQHDDVHAALGVSEALLRISPQEPRLYYDAAVLATRLDYYQAAIGYWKKYISLSKDKKEIEEARYILSRLETALH